VLLFGVFKCVNRRHSRLLARIPPTRLAWWSFLTAAGIDLGLWTGRVASSVAVAP